MFVVYQPSYVNYDARYSLLWAYDLLHGIQPDYEIPFAPTPHPLQTAVSFLALPFGDSADPVLLAMILACFGGLVWLSYRLGAELFTPWVGLVTAAVVLTRPALHRDALIAYQDIAFAMLIVWAVLLEAQRRRRGVGVLALLAVAGLMRPEAWVLSGLYVLYLWPTLAPRRRALFAAICASAPVLWALSDLLVTGDLLHSLHGTSELAERNDRRREIHQVPYWTAQYLGFVLREPLVLGVPIGLAFAWVHRSRRALLPLAVALAMLLVFAIGPIFGLPLIGRYVRTPAVLLSLFYGLAVAGWLSLPQGRSRTRWRALGLLALALSVAFIPWHARMLSDLDERFDRDGRAYDALHDVADSPAFREAFESCGPLSVSDHRPIPHLRWWLRAKPETIYTIEAGLGDPSQLILLPRDGPAARRFYRDALPRTRPPAGYGEIYGNRNWVVYAAPGCVLDLPR